MNDTDDIGSNPTNNPHILDMIEQRVSRRSVLSGGVAVAAAGFLGGASAKAEADDNTRGGPGGYNPTLGFTEVSPSDADEIRVPDGYDVQVFAPWGSKLFHDSPAFQEDASNSAADQAKQVGFNHDGMHYFPLPLFPNSRGLLCVNHEYTDANQIYSATQGSAITNTPDGREKVAKALAGHGVSVLSIVKGWNGKWDIETRDPRNRRITGTTPMKFSGPVEASHPMLQSTITPSPRGTLNNCAHGYTPWGTYLTCEENWNGYFGTADLTWRATALEARYGINAGGFGYNWHLAEPRFDLAVNRNELNHFGWTVEINPFLPNSQPVKRTALGRFKHEGATCTERDGHVVVYSGDDENREYVYKYVSRKPWRQMLLRGTSPLDDGTLYVGKFNADGTGEWLPLVHGVGPLTTANGWVDQADVLIRTRQAGDAVGATKLHRPEWVAVHPGTQEVFVALTNGSGAPSAANGNRDPNPYGHILRFNEDPVDVAKFYWDVFLLAGDPAYLGTSTSYPDGGTPLPADQPVFGSPDGLWVDSQGILWIQTDISNSSQNLASRGYDNIKNNQMLAAVPDTGQIKRFLTGPRGCEITGVVMTPDLRTMFVNVQHPGESTTYWNTQFGAPSTTNPTTVSSWPYGAGRRPRPATIVITKKDGGRIGS